MKHLQCVKWSLLAAILGFAAVAWGQAQEPTTAAVASDPIADYLVRLVSGGGLPAVLAVAAWWARGAVGAGVPVVVQLHEADRALVKRAVRAFERSDDSDEPPPPRAT